MRIVWAAIAVTVALIGIGLLAARPAEAQFGLRTPTATRTAAATGTPTLRPTFTPTRTPTPARAAGRATPTPTPTLPLLVILPAPSVKESLAGDVFAPPGVALSANYPTVFGDYVGFGMVNLFDRAVGSGEGEGIASVEFTVLDAAFGTVVHRATRTDEDRFCAFGGATPACAVWDFRAYGGAWPSGEPARSGRYILIATAQGTTPGHQGTWTLPFEVRLARDGLQETDGAARIRAVEAAPGGVVIHVETFGFMPLAEGTHLHIYGDLLNEEEAVGGAAGVVEYPETDANVPAHGMAPMLLPANLIPRGARAICVAVAHPDHTILPGRGDCAPLPRGY